MAENRSFLDRHYFLLRRLHSLTGIVPIGMFLIVHLITNSSVVWGLLDGRKSQYGHAGAATFQHEVDFIHSMPFLLLIEVLGLWAPIAFHSALGVVYAMSGKSNVGRYGYQDNWRYTWQRISGYVGVLFIFWHVATLRWGWTFLLPGGTHWTAEYAGSTMAAVMQGGTEGMRLSAGVPVTLAYLIGVGLLVFHFANGLWTAAITWGVTISAKSQRQWGRVCAGLGAALLIAGWGAVIGFATLNYKSARAAEEGLRRGAHAEATGVEVLK